MEWEPIQVRRVEGRVLIENRPKVTMIDVVCLKFDPERWGYRRLWREPWLFGDLYARGYWRWLWLRTRHAVERAPWRVAEIAHDHDLIHPNCSPGIVPRWRDLRFGPDRRR